MISIIIPAYNAGECIARAIISVLNQTYRDYEIIVIDDGSIDNTREALRPFNNKITYFWQENAGVSVARNKGVENARGKWIAFLDADDEFLPRKLTVQSDILQKNPHLKWCASNYNIHTGEQIKPRSNVNRLQQLLGNNNYFPNYFLSRANYDISFLPSTVVIQKKIFNELGGFDPGLFLGEDKDFFCLVAHHYPQVGFSAEPLMQYNLDICDPILEKRRIEAKRGIHTRYILTRHMHIAQKNGKLPDFMVYAKKEIKAGLLMMLYNGFFAEAKETIDQFSDIIPFYWRYMTYLITSMPPLSLPVMHAIVNLLRLLRLERTPNRRWIDSKMPRA